MSISTSWAIGFVVGILLVALLCGVMVKMARRNGGGKGEFDERQLAARGKAYAMGYYTLLLYLLFWMIMRSLETSFFMEPESVLIGALLSLAVFVGYCIFHDAYFKASESPRFWIIIICAAGLVNLALGVLHLVRDKLYGNMNLYVGALLVVTLICLVIKRAMDRRAGED